jgi:hypothetical protein
MKHSLIIYRFYMPIFLNLHLSQFYELFMQLLCTRYLHYGQQTIGFIFYEWSLKQAEQLVGKTGLFENFLFFNFLI